MLRIVGDVFERLHWRHVEQLPEAVVSRNTALAIAQDVDCRQIQDLSIVLLELLQELRKIVKHQRAGMRGSERIEEILERDRGHDLSRGPAGNDSQILIGIDRLVGLCGSELEIVGHQAVHAIDGNKLFGQRDTAR